MMLMMMENFFYDRAIDQTLTLITIVRVCGCVQFSEARLRYFTVHWSSVDYNMVLDEGDDYDDDDKAAAF